MKNPKRPKRKAEDTEPNSFSVTVSGGQVGNISQDTADYMDKRQNTTNNRFGEKKFGLGKVDGIEGDLIINH